MNRFLQILLCTLILASCGAEQKEVELRVEVMNSALLASGGQTFVKVYSNSSWTLELTDEATGLAPDWASLSVSAGSGDKTNIILTYQTNTAETSVRKLRVTASADSNNRTCDCRAGSCR